MTGEDVLMHYKYYFSAVQCDKFINKLMKGADLGVEHVGFKVTISFTSDKELTKEQIKNLTKYIESSEQEKSLKQYLTNVKFEGMIKEEATE